MTVAADGEGPDCPGTSQEQGSSPGVMSFLWTGAGSAHRLNKPRRGHGVHKAVMEAPTGRASRASTKVCTDGRTTVQDGARQGRPRPPPPAEELGLSRIYSPSCQIPPLVDPTGAGRLSDSHDASRHRDCRRGGGRAGQGQAPYSRCASSSNLSRMTRRTGYRCLKGIVSDRQTEKKRAPFPKKSEGMGGTALQVLVPGTATRSICSISSLHLSRHACIERARHSITRSLARKEKAPSRAARNWVGPLLTHMGRYYSPALTVRTGLGGSR